MFRIYCKIMRIKIDQLAKMEGHLDFVGHILNGDVAKAKIETTEGVRLIESILVDRKFYDAPIITARICGICPIVHSLNTIKAIENAFGIHPTIQTVKLRKLMELSQVIHSHALHLYFLSMPDFYGINDDLDFIKKHPSEASAAIKNREFALKILEVVGGRAIHPIATEVGGFKVLPTKKALQSVLDLYKEAIQSAQKLVKFAAKLNFPKFERKMEFASLWDNKEYAIYDGQVKFLSGKKFDAKNYGKVVDEYQLLSLAAKRANYLGKSFMNGALARLNINHSKLSKEAGRVVKDLKSAKANGAESIFFCDDNPAMNPELFKRLNSSCMLQKGGFLILFKTSFAQDKGKLHTPTNLILPFLTKTSSAKKISSSGTS